MHLQVGNVVDYKNSLSMKMDVLLCMRESTCSFASMQWFRAGRAVFSELNMP
jgi:hypothetical protein